MKQRKLHILARGLVLGIALLVLFACGNDASAEYFESDGTPILSGSGPREVQMLLAAPGSELVPAQSTDGREGSIDVSNLSNGYVGVQVRADVEGVFMVEKTDTGESYPYALETNGSWCFYPLSYGSGSYKFSTLLHQSGTSYDIFQEYEANVTIADEKMPFLVQNQIVNYNEGSAVVALGQELAAGCADDMEVIRQVYWWICENISYDTAKASNIAAYGQYVPNPDDIISNRTGICYDYASVAAAMLRSNGIPTKLIMGDVNNGDEGTIYHAWNEVWTDETGWIAVKFEVKANNWNRVDTTFAAAGDSSISDFIGDGNNYYGTSTH